VESLSLPNQLSEKREQTITATIRSLDSE